MPINPINPINFKPFISKENSPEHILNYFDNLPEGSNLLQENNNNPFFNSYLGIKTPIEDVTKVSKSNNIESKSLVDWLKERKKDDPLLYNPFKNSEVQYSNIPATKSKKEFLSRYNDEFEELSKKTGINKKLLIAQVGLETGWGAHTPGNNIGGIKANSSWTGATQELLTKEQGPNGLVSVKQKFRKYATAMEGFNDYADFLIKNKRYNAVKGINDPMKAAEIMAKTGYATDKNYKQKLQSIIKTLT